MSWRSVGVVQYSGMIRLWRNAWEEFTPFLDYDPELDRVVLH